MPCKIRYYAEFDTLNIVHADISSSIAMIASAILGWHDRIVKALIQSDMEVLYLLTLFSEISRTNAH